MALAAARRLSRHRVDAGVHVQSDGRVTAQLLEALGVDPAGHQEPGVAVGH